MRREQTTLGREGCGGGQLPIWPYLMCINPRREKDLHAPECQTMNLSSSGNELQLILGGKLYRSEKNRIESVVVSTLTIFSDC